MTIILRNKAYCLGCGDTIESTHRHDYQVCSCGDSMVDGGHDYFRGNTNPNQVNLHRQVESFDSNKPEDLHALMDDMEEWIEVYEQKKVSPAAWEGLYSRFADRWIKRIRSLADYIRKLEDRLEINYVYELIESDEPGLVFNMVPAPEDTPDVITCNAIATYCLLSSIWEGESLEDVQELAKLNFYDEWKAYENN